jgi:hypothetical protein
MLLCLPDLRKVSCWPRADLVQSLTPVPPKKESFNLDRIRTNIGTGTSLLSALEDASSHIADICRQGAHKKFTDPYENI